MARARDRRRGILWSVDWLTVGVYAALLALGWLSVCGASYEVEAGINFLDFSSRSGVQLVWIGTSVILGAILLFTDESLYDYATYFIYATILVLLFATPFLAHDIKGSLSWIKIGPFSIQPAEFGKFSTALCLAKYISHYDFSMRRARDFVASCAIIVMPVALILLQRETGCALVYLAFFLVLYREGLTGSILLAGVLAITYFVIGVRYGGVPIPWAEGSSLGTFCVATLIAVVAVFMARTYEPERLCHIHLWRLLAMVVAVVGGSLLVSRYVVSFNVTYVALGVCAALVVYLLGLTIATRSMRYLYVALFAIGSVGFHYSCDMVMNNVLETHQQTRIRVLLGMEDDPRGAGYNVIQAKIAIGSGGIRGKGFLNGTQTKLKYVPEQDTDFIFCTVGEEEGFAGCATVLVLFLVLILRLIVLSERQPDTMGRVYGYGVACVIFIHLFINVGMVLGLTPVIGIPLPFFSYGGSSMWGFTLLLFIFLRMDAAHKRLRRRT